MLATVATYAVVLAMIRVRLARQVKALAAMLDADGERPNEAPARPRANAPALDDRPAAAKPAERLARAAAEPLKPARPAAAAAPTRNGRAPSDPKVDQVRPSVREAARVDLHADPAVRAAREGPSVETLRRHVIEAPCDLSNIEVYYRLGMACLAGGDWSAAMRHFEGVEAASPGYRDAARRVEEIRQWYSTTGSKVSGVTGASGASASRYQLRGELGRGGMAVVYRAADTVLDRDVALKFIGDVGPESRETRELFLREARSAAKLNHPNVVTLHDVGTLDGRTFIAMEFVEGKTVAQLIAEQKRLPTVEALRIAAQVLAALEYAHARGIIHRDVKPSNMMCSLSGQVKLMDFGLAKPLSSGTKMSFIAGTPAYMPPEQVAGQHVDHRADLFAVGASLFQMLSGSLPFDSIVRTGPAPSVRAVHASVPELIDEALRRALDPEPSRRFATAAEFAAPIHNVLAVFDRSLDDRSGRQNQPAPPSARATESSRAVDRPRFTPAPPMRRSGPTTVPASGVVVDPQSVPLRVIETNAPSRRSSRRMPSHEAQTPTPTRGARSARSTDARATASRKHRNESSIPPPA